MSAAAQPWMKFYPQDWRADEKLRMCSLSARGLWIEMLAIMHRSEQYGFLLIAGSIPTDAQLAVQVGASPQEVTELLAQLRQADVFSCAANGAIYSRRMTRDNRKSIALSKNGKKGGDATARKTAENERLLEQNSGKGSTPDTRGQSSDANASGAAPPGDPVKSLFDIGVSLLTEADTPISQARSIIGKLRKDLGDDGALSAVLKCRRAAPSNPVEWLAGLSKRSAQTNEGLYAAAKRLAA